ncbi:MAG TPA: alpha/beta hydrolase-fold protein [Candidatus Krumholzibacteria bacterium]|nr:alpha/beta hydrolase-fold protein [Candidatus Krumholzibacteria bacterium]
MRSRPTLAALLLACALIASGCRKAEAPATPADPVPPHDTFTLDSQATGDTRVLNVWTPPGYADGTAAYPVLYMPDGGLAEDFPHIANTIAALVAEGAVAPMLVVGIENTVRRRDLTGPTTVPGDAELVPVNGGSAAFRTFIRDELMPEVGRRYRVDGRRAIVGESVAGLFVMETLMLEPGLFDTYIAMDPSLWWNGHDLVVRAHELLPARMAQPTRLWFAGSDAEDIHVYTEQLAAMLAESAPADLAWTYSPQPAEHHNTIFRATKDAAFRWALWRP